MRFSLQDISGLMQKASDHLNVDPRNLAWNDFQSYLKESNEEMDWKSISSSISGLGGWKNIKTVYFGDSISSTSILVRGEASKIRKETKAKLSKKIVDDAIKNKVFSVFKDGKYKIERLPRRAKALERHQHLIISDTHFGSNLHPETGVRAYGPEEESRSMARIVAGTLDFKINHRKDTKLFVNIMGDLIQGKIHDPLSSDRVSIQVCRAIYVLGRSLAILASEFPEVEVNVCTGNHDRDPMVHQERASTDKYDSYATIIYYSLKQQLSSIPNIKFIITKAPFFTYTSFNQHYWGTHGDNQIRTPNPMGAINVSKLENEINKINARQNSPKYSVFMVGHIHTAMKISMKNGATLITNPPLIPTDQYALSLNIDPDSPTGQQLFESVEGYPCGDLRTLWVTENDRKDQSLDKIIQPFKGL